MNGGAAGNDTSANSGLRDSLLGSLGTSSGAVDMTSTTAVSQHSSTIGSVVGAPSELSEDAQDSAMNLTVRP